MKTVSQKELDRLKKKGGVSVKRKLGTKKKQAKKKQGKSSETVATESEALSGAVPPERPAPAQLDTKPFAAMTASMAAHNASMEKLIEHNTLALMRFTEKVEQMKPRERKPWRAKVRRTKDKLIDEVDIIPMDTAK